MMRRLLVGVLLLGSLFFFLRLRVYKVQTRSMMPAIMPKDYVVISKWLSDPRAGDIAAIKEEADGRSFILIKRVLASEGDTLRIQNEGISSNGINVPHDLTCLWLRGRTDPGSNAQEHITERTPGSSVMPCQLLLVHSLKGQDAFYVMKKDQLFIVGDNYAESEDSRYFGPVLSDNIVGKIIAVF